MDPRLGFETIRIGHHEFDNVSYDADGDVLHLHQGKPVAAAETFGTPEGHAVKFDADGGVIGLTIVNAKWLAERDGRITITIPERIETSASDLARRFPPSVQSVAGTPPATTLTKFSRWRVVQHSKAPSQ